MAQEPSVTTKPSRKISIAKNENREALDSLFTTPPDETPDDIAVDNLLLDFKAMETAEVRINRVLPNNKLAYIETVHPNEFRFDDLRDKHGGGKFRIYVYGVDEEGRKQLRASPQFDIEKPKENPVAQIAVQNANNDVANIVAQSMAGLGQLMIQGFENLGKMIVQNQQPQKSTADILTEMKLMKEIFSTPQVATPPAPPTDLLEKSLDMLTRGIEMGKGMSEVRGEAGTTDVLLETVKSLGPAFMQAMSQNQAPQVQHQNAQPLPPPIPAPPIPPVPSATENQQGNDDMNFIQKQRLKMGLSMLVDAAERNLSTETYAEIALDNLSDDEVDELFTQENPLALFAEIEPRINQHKLWFELLINQMREMLIEEPENDITGVSEITPVNHEAHDTNQHNPLQDS